MSLKKTMLRYGYLPLVLLGGNAIALVLLSGGYPHWTLAPLFLVAVALSFTVERMIPYHRDWNTDHDDTKRDVVHAIVNESANVLTVLSIPVLAALVPWMSIWPLDWPFWVQVLLAIFIADFGITMAHYFSHRFDILWRFHAVHHSVTRMYGFNGLMKHPLHQTMETIAGTTPLLLMGMPVDVAFGLVFAAALQLLLQHSNADFWVGPFKYLLAINVVHRFHHVKESDDGDINFGLFTTLWDHMLGTFHYEDERSFKSGDLGIGTEQNYPTGYVAQLIQPFRQKPSAEAHADV